MIPETSGGFIYSSSSDPIPIQKERDGEGGEERGGAPCLSQSRRLRTEKSSKRSALTVSAEVRRTVRRTATAAAASQPVSHCARVREPCGAVREGRLYDPRQCSETVRPRSSTSSTGPAADQRHSSARSAARASLHFTRRTKLFRFLFF